MERVKLNFLDVLSVVSMTDLFEEEEERDLLIIRNTEFNDILNEDWKEENAEYLEGEEVNKFVWELCDKEDMLSEAYCWEYEDRIMCEFTNGERIYIDRI